MFKPHINSCLFQLEYSSWLLFMFVYWNNSSLNPPGTELIFMNIQVYSCSNRFNNMNLDNVYVGSKNDMNNVKEAI